MAYAYVNAMNIAGTLMAPPELSATDTREIIAGGYPIFQVSTPVDVSGLEFAIVGHGAGTALLAAQATADNTVLMQPYDGTTTASGVTGNNPLVGSATAATAATAAPIGFGNIYTGSNSWTGKHNAQKRTGTSTTDLDADDWVNLDVMANITGAAGFGELGWNAFFVHGVPGGVA